MCVDCRPVNCTMDPNIHHKLTQIVCPSTGPAESSAAGAHYFLHGA
jgi:hypothetical protein